MVLHQVPWRAPAEVSRVWKWGAGRAERRAVEEHRRHPASGCCSEAAGSRAEPGTAAALVLPQGLAGCEQCLLGPQGCLSWGAWPAGAPRLLLPACLVALLPAGSSVARQPLPAWAGHRSCSSGGSHSEPPAGQGQGQPRLFSSGKLFACSAPEAPGHLS